MKQMRQSHMGPGRYTEDNKNMYRTHHMTPKMNGFGTASRDTAFSKYSSMHKELVRKGLH
jgi:hypothetical protein